MLPSIGFPLNIADYEIIKNKLKDLQNKEGKDSFLKQLQILKEFIDKDQSQKESRSILCGIAYHNQCICVNIENLKNTLGKCKSTVNNCLQQMGYSSIKSKLNANAILYEAIPSLKTFGNVKKWSVRTKSYPPKPNYFIVEDANPMIFPSSKSEEYLSISKDIPLTQQKLIQSPIESTFNSNYKNNDFLFNDHHNDFLSDVVFNSNFENINQAELNPLFDEISSYF